MCSAGRVTGALGALALVLARGCSSSESGTRGDMGGSSPSFDARGDRLAEDTRPVLLDASPSSPDRAPPDAAADSPAPAALKVTDKVMHESAENLVIETPSATYYY